MSDLRVFHSLDEVPADFGPCALTIGNFDGLHVGHRRIMRRVAEIARANGWTAAVLTFDPHPARVVAPDRAPRLLSGVEERTRYMVEEGIERVIVARFNQELAHLEPEQFVSGILVGKLHAKAVLVGANFRFGFRHAGDVAMLRDFGEKYGFTTEIVPVMRLRGGVVSSSEARRVVDAGNATRAWRLLGRPYGVEGSVVRGHGIGKKATVPTLNLDTAAEILPRAGVYVTCTRDLDSSRSWQSISNVGYRPTFGGDNRLSVETYLLSEYDGNAPSHIRLEFLRRIRDERKFDSPDALKAQILRDAGRAQAWFRRMRRWSRR